MDVVAVSSAAVIVVHGRVLGRPFTALHAGFAGALVLTGGVFIGLSGHPPGGAILGVVAAAVVFVWPSDSRYEPAALERCRCSSTRRATIRWLRLRWRRGKSYVFSGDGGCRSGVPRSGGVRGRQRRSDRRPGTLRRGGR